MDKLIREITEAWFHLEYKFKGKTEKHYTHLMNYRELSDELKQEADNIISLSVNTFLLRHFLGGFITHLDDTLLARLKTQAAPIIYAFLSGQQPFYSGKRWVLKRDTLFKGIGMHTAARVKKWRPYRAKKFLEAGLDELGAEGVMDKRIIYEDKKGTHYGWEYDKLRDSYALRKAPKKIEQPTQIAAQPIDVERTAQLARSMWAQSRLKQAHMHPSVFLNVAKRAIAFYEQYRHWLGYHPELGHGVTLVLSLALMCLERGNEPAGANWWAQAKFWEQELPYWLEDMCYMKQPSSGPTVSPEFYNRPGGEHWPAVPVGPFDAAPSPDDEDLY